MEITLETVVFYFLAAFITVFSILTVTTHRMVRSATYLLFVLFGTAGIYFLLGYTFLGSVQIMVYAGDDEFPWYLPQPKVMGIIQLDSRDIPEL